LAVNPGIFCLLFSLLSTADSGGCVMAGASSCHRVLQMPGVVRAPLSPARRGLRMPYLHLHGAVVH
jgi:hypothetical protein